MYNAALQARVWSGEQSPQDMLHFMRVKRSALMMKHFEPSWIHTHSLTHSQTLL